VSEENVLQLKDIRRSFVQGGEKLDILRGVNLTVKRGEIVALLGPSGCGKTTLLQIAGLLENPTSGDVIIKGHRVSSTADDYRTALRRTMLGFVYQFHHLLSDFTALENLLLPQYVAGIEKDKAKARAEQLLQSVGLSKRADHYPSQLSGGEQQRIAIARGLVNKPALLLADEPTGNLDPHTAEEVFQLLVKTIAQEKTGALIVTHNHELAKRMDRVLELRDGVV
jgi:lipoprotein-releasing system ATP-binding protein